MRNREGAEQVLHSPEHNLPFALNAHKYEQDCSNRADTDVVFKYLCAGVFSVPLGSAWVGLPRMSENIRDRKLPDELFCGFIVVADENQ
jgi:hypothetical protein